VPVFRMAFLLYVHPRYRYVCTLSTHTIRPIASPPTAPRCGGSVQTPAREGTRPLASGTSSHPPEARRPSDPVERRHEVPVYAKSREGALVEEIECDLEGDVECRQLLRTKAAYVVCQGTLR